MAWKDGFMKRNPGLAKIIYGASFLVALIALAATFGPDETREFARDIAEKWGLVDPDTTPGKDPP